ncbi:MAG: metallopeptidase TldD-related protein [Candidatus Cloacimonetes bacterium]|nr:TldD/PmbA family protein [Candidatus Cloacimonadota bacterium]MDD2424194.1 metallopeptidase TldD-related protein [Candidatus Cloacimonadota bacterium]MDD3562042.1 metallopeptidase TldD-related protein [Candidatus Cloacimonadota bacterium]
MNEQLHYLKSALQKHSELKYVLTSREWQTDFLRFYQSQTNYNISKDSSSLDAILYKGKKSCSFTIDHPDKGKIDEALQTALDMIDIMPEDPDFVDVEDDLTLAAPRKIVNNIEALGLDEKTRILGELAKRAAKYDFELYGTFICNYQSWQLLNSNGLDKTSTQSPIYLEVKAVHKDSQVTVLETFGGDDFKYFDEAAFGKSLLTKVALAQNPVVDVAPGEYEVILAPRCVAEFAQYLSYGMRAGSVDSHNSFFEGKLNEQLFPASFSLTDDPTDPQMIRMDYGDQGHIYRPLKLIEDGYFRAFMCGQYYHHKLGLPKNGNTGECLKVNAGNAKLEDMIKSVKKGLYISSLHYMNFINARETSLTGLTRDGTFLIEDGKISKVVNNLRFTERISRIFENVIEFEDSAHTIPFSDNYGEFSVNSSRAPHARIKDFNISSSTRTI